MGPRHCLLQLRYLSCCGASWPSSLSQSSTADSATASRSSAAELPPSLALALRSLGLLRTCSFLLFPGYSQGGSTWRSPSPCRFYCWSLSCSFQDLQQSRLDGYLPEGGWTKQAKF